jgi:hypothetical protein
MQLGSLWNFKQGNIMDTSTNNLNAISYDFFKKSTHSDMDSRAKNAT